MYNLRVKRPLPPHALSQALNVRITGGHEEPEAAQQHPARDLRNFPQFPKFRCEDEDSGAALLGKVP